MNHENLSSEITPPAGKSAGGRFRQALADECPLQVAGTINAYSAKLAERAGFRAIYLSGAGVANASLGLPDLGMTTLADVLEDARRITAATPLPLLVDCDTGWGSVLTIARTIREMIRAGVAAVHLEDQLDLKRCGHRPGKQLVTTSKMEGRIKAAVDARTDDQFMIMARTDAVAVEGFDAALERAQRYIEAGADMIFAEALTDLTQFRLFAESVNVPVLANMTEFGRSPLLTRQQLRDAGIQLVLYPLTAFRAMSATAEKVYQTLRDNGTQADLLDGMQSRADLYDVLDYHALEQQLDKQSLLPSDELSSEGLLGEEPGSEE
jgi:methylisocitrate lyase